MTNRELKEFREKRGYSQNQFAALLGVSQPAISNAEAKLDRLMSDNLFRKFKSTFQADQKTTVTDPEVNIELSIRMRKSQFDQIQSHKGVVDLTDFFQVL